MLMQDNTHTAALTFISSICTVSVSIALFVVWEALVLIAVDGYTAKLVLPTTVGSRGGQPGDVYIKTWSIAAKTLVNFT